MMTVHQMASLASVFYKNSI